jgi:hypothetical protein
MPNRLALFLAVVQRIACDEARQVPPRSTVRPVTAGFYAPYRIIWREDFELVSGVHAWRAAHAPRAAIV